MYAFLIARIKPEEDYDFFTYGGKPITLDFRGKPVVVSKGTTFGVRKSSNNKQIRLVLNDDVNRVFTISLDQAKQLSKGIVHGS